MAIRGVRPIIGSMEAIMESHTGSFCNSGVLTPSKDSRNPNMSDRVARVEFVEAHTEADVRLSRGY